MKSRKDARKSPRLEEVFEYLEVSLRRTVDPAVAACIPDYDVVDVPKALRLLEKYARPFDFLGLPEHLRKIIYSVSFIDHATKNHYSDRYIIDECGMMEEQLPDILSVSRTVRSEASALFHNCHGLHFYGFPLEDSQLLTSSMRRLAGETLRDNLKLVKTLFLEYKNGNIKLYLDAKAGLRVEFQQGEFSKAGRDAIFAASGGGRK
ncbi:hypothetical protein LTR86_010671 [Recurvomyces mirabilis]|nr:hypothetical protein LTR86_010671 [Recurvomyces mirabilis]